MRSISNIALAIALVIITSNLAAAEGWVAERPAQTSQGTAQRIKPVKNARALSMPFHPKTGQPIHSGRLVVMFDQDIVVRAGRTSGHEILSQRGTDLRSTYELLLKYGATIRQALDTDPAELAKLRAEAQNKSRKPMPDLASIMYVDGIAPTSLLAAARDFLGLPEVEAVEIERLTMVAQSGIPSSPCFEAACGPDAGANPTAPCHFPHNATDNFVPAPVFPKLSCAVPNPPVGFCSDAGVCATVTGLRPSCATVWDEYCAVFANLVGSSLYGDDTSSYDTCLRYTPGLYPLLAQVANGGGFVLWFNAGSNAWDPTEISVALTTSPFIGHALGGSSCAGTTGPGGTPPSCCERVCLVDNSCCSIAWDATCTELAISFAECYHTMNFTNGLSPAISEGGSPFVPSAQAVSPLFSQNMLDAKEGGVLPQMPTTNGNATVTIDGVPGVSVAIGSAPIALYGTARKSPDPIAGGVADPAFATFLRVSGYRGGGLDIAQFMTYLRPIGSPNSMLTRMKVALVEPSAMVQHEDLCPNGLGTPSKIIVEPGQIPFVMVAPEGVQNIGAPRTEHGTADLGVLFAEDNAIGVTGVIPDVQPYFFPGQSFEGGFRLATAMTNAVIKLSKITAEDPLPGNVIVMPIVNADGSPLNTPAAGQNPLLYANILVTGMAVGVTFVIAAGNESLAVPDPVEGTEDVIVVGGVLPGFLANTGDLIPGTSPPQKGPLFPGLNYSRAPSSNFSRAPATVAGANVTVSAWGHGVGSIGYGDLFCGINAPLATSVAAVNAYSQNRLRTYSATFGGTSAATAQIGGVVALMQALGKELNDGQPFTPAQIHDLLIDPVNVYRQSGAIAPTSHLAGFAEFGDTLAAGVAEAGFVGGYPNLTAIAAAEISFPTIDNATTFTIPCGLQLSGSPTSLLEIDNKYLKAMTARPGPGSSSSGLGPPVFYPSSSKRILDVQVIRDIPITPEELTGMSLSVTGRTISSASALVLAFIYNPAGTGSWMFMPPYLGTMTGVDATLPQFVLPTCINPQQVVTPNGTGGCSAAVRVVIIPIGGLGQSQIWLDRIKILYSPGDLELIDVPAPCGN